MKIFKVTTECDLRTFTLNSYPQGSFCLAALLRARDVRVNGVRTGENVRLTAGDEVCYYTSPRQESLESHAAVFEDENIIICDKYSGVSSEGLLSELCGGGRYYAVHRLDTNTQGLIVFAKNRAAEEELVRAFKARLVKKRYTAVCKDNFTAESGSLRHYLEKCGGGVRVYDSPKKGAVSALMDYRVTGRSGGLAQVEIVLHTGRTHQIRAQLSYIGCPVLGDTRYGDSAINDRFSAKRQRLVSKEIVFLTGGVLAYLNGRAFESSFEVN